MNDKINFNLTPTIQQIKLTRAQVIYGFNEKKSLMLLQYLNKPMFDSVTDKQFHQK